MQVLKKNHAFSHVIRRGKRLHGRTMTIYYRKRQDALPSKFGVTCTRGIGIAVERNRLKRQLREICRAFMPQLPDGHDFVFMAKPNAKSSTYQVMKSEAEQLLQQASLIREGDRSSVC